MCWHALLIKKTDTQPMERTRQLSSSQRGRILKTLKKIIYPFLLLKGNINMSQKRSHLMNHLFTKQTINRLRCVNIKYGQFQHFILVFPHSVSRLSLQRNRPAELLGITSLLWKHLQFRPLAWMKLLTVVLPLSWAHYQ